MATSVNVLTGLGSGPFVYRSFKNNLGMVTGARTKPRMVTPALRGYTLGLHCQEWAERKSNVTVAGSYYVRVEPIYADMTDPNALPLKGTANTQNTTAGNSFQFEPLPMEYPCTGYRVYAGTVSGTLYYQGALTGRWNTNFTIGTTWTYTTSGGAATFQSVGPIAFGHAQEAYQLEGNIDARHFLGGGKKYNTGYAKVATASNAPVLTGGTTTTVAAFTAVSAGSFRVRLRWNEVNATWDISGDYDEYFDFTGLDFSACTTESEIATVMQTAIRARVIPKLISGSLVEQTIAVWNDIDDGSFDIWVDGAQYHITGLDFTAATDMDGVATVIQAGMVTAGLASASCTWDSTASRLVIKAHSATGAGEIVTNPTFTTDTAWTKGTGWSIPGGYAYYNSIAVTNLYQTFTAVSGPNRKFTVSFTRSASTGYLPYTIYYIDQGAGTIYNSGVLVADGTTTSTVTLTTAANYMDKVRISAWSAGGSTVTQRFTNASIVEVLNRQLLSYCYRHSAGTGTDISGYMACKEDSVDVVLNRRGKGATTETVAWSTDHYVITGPTSGGQYQIGWLETCKANVGTDISGSGYLDMRSTTTTGSRTIGKTAFKTVYGDGVTWGPWVEGMAFRVSGEGTKYLIDKYIDTDCFQLDSTMTDTGALQSWQEYVLEPYNTQFYYSALGNPFKWEDTSTNAVNIIQLPTADNDVITAIRRTGSFVAIFMEHHIWVVDGVDVSAPRMISDVYGAPNDGCCVSTPLGVAVCTGEDFIMVNGGNVINIDPEKRMKSYMQRISALTPNIHGVFLSTVDSDLVKWYIGIDSSTKYDTAVVYDIKTGNFWLENVKDCTCSAIIRDANDIPYLITGSSYDSDNTVPSFVFVHGEDYKNDGATQDTTKTRQGIVASVGANVTTAGYLTCAASGALATFTANITGTTLGYFKVTIDGTTYNVGPVDCTGAASMAAVAALIQTAIRAATGGSETCVYSTDHFVITSGTTTNRSAVSALMPYHPTAYSVDMSSSTYMNGRSGKATATGPVMTSTLTLNTMASVAATLEQTNDAEKGVYIYVCDTNFENGQYARVVSNNATTVTVTPNFSTAPVAGWYWYIGGIVPIWTKWFDWGSPHTKRKVHGISFTVKPGLGSTGNKVAVRGMQDLASTVRTRKLQTIGSGQDTVNTKHLQDKPSTQSGITITRPNSVEGLEIEDITIVSAPIA